jgi:hypothetical protein
LRKIDVSELLVFPLELFGVLRVEGRLVLDGRDERGGSPVVTMLEPLYLVSQCRRQLRPGPESVYEMKLNGMELN